MPAHPGAPVEAVLSSQCDEISTRTNFSCGGIRIYIVAMEQQSQNENKNKTRLEGIR